MPLIETKNLLEASGSKKLVKDGTKVRIWKGLKEIRGSYKGLHGLCLMHLYLPAVSATESFQWLPGGSGCNRDGRVSGSKRQLQGIWKKSFAQTHLVWRAVGPSKQPKRFNKADIWTRNSPAKPTAYEHIPGAYQEDATEISRSQSWLDLVQTYSNA